MPDKYRPLDHLVFAVHPKNIERYAKQISELLDTEFEITSDPEILGEGSKVYMSWDSGFEFVAPGVGTEQGARLTDYLETHGEGPTTLIIGVPDIEAAVARAESLGYKVGGSVNPEDPEEKRAKLSWTDKIDDIDVRFLEQQFLGMNLAFGQVTYRP